MTQVKDSHFASVILQDSKSVDFLLTIFAFAAFSPRFPTVLHPIPPPYRNGRECDITRLRADLLNLPPLRLHHGTIPAFLHSIRAFRPLLTCVLFQTPVESDTPPLLLRSASPAADTLPHAFSVPTGDTRDFTAFHGTSPDRWYSIIRTGLRVWPDDALSVTNGRVFGDAAYLSRAFSVALNFAPHVTLGAKVGFLKGVSAVGCFGVRRGAGVVMEGAEGVPESYVVVREEGALSLVGISVLAEAWDEEEGGRGVCGVGVFGGIVLLYVFALVFLSSV